MYLFPHVDGEWIFMPLLCGERLHITPQGLTTHHKKQSLSSRVQVSFSAAAAR
jgi:hypothetical protein